jgi:trehalose synthase-fused probable maltokinase
LLELTDMGTTGKNLTFLDISESLSWAADAEVITALEDDFLPSFLAKARWFPRDRESAINPRIIARLPFSDDSTFFVVIEIDHRERYLLILRADWPIEAPAKRDKSVVARLRRGEREGLLRDVATDPAFVRQLLNHLRRDASIAGSGWRLDFRPTTKLGNRSPQAPSRVRAIEGEQSNSTALVDQDYVVKLYRHIESGHNPEIEMGHFLTETAEFTHAPALLGHLEGIHNSARYAFGVIHAFVPNRGDAWTWSTERIDIFLNAVAEGSEERDKSLTARRDYLQWIRRLGCRVAEMHQSLAHRSDLGAFRPEPIDESDIDFWSTDIVERAARVCNKLEEASLSENDRLLVERLIRIEPTLSDYVTSLIRPSLGRCKIRHHGDLHLGQVLVAGDDAVIIDFEGEPSRPLADRRRKAPAARDVAGLLRSLDYAAMAARQQRLASEQLTTSALRTLITWRDQSTAAFLAAYHESIGQSVLWPDRAEDSRGLLNFFLVEKALYEVEYELSYRPAWLAVPLQGALRILEEEGLA